MSRVQSQVPHGTPSPAHCGLKKRKQRKNSRHGLPGPEVDACVSPACVLGRPPPRTAGGGAPAHGGRGREQSRFLPGVRWVRPACAQQSLPPSCPWHSASFPPSGQGHRTHGSRWSPRATLPCATAAPPGPGDPSPVPWSLPVWDGVGCCEIQGFQMLPLPQAPPPVWGCPAYVSNRGLALFAGCNGGVCPPPGLVETLSH